MKRCVITGAAGGIGQALMFGFATAGYDVIGLDREPRPENFPKAFTYYQCDLANQSEIIATFQQMTTAGGLDILINNAAYIPEHERLEAIDVSAINYTMAVNVISPIICSQQFIQLNRDRDYGRIINIASTRWAQNEAHHDLYGTAKGGLVSLTSSLSVSLRETKITVNTISPGWIHTGDIAELSARDHAQHPSGRVGTPSDIVRAALFLSDSENDFINGHNLVVDGGMSQVMHYD